jgi:hypothetical protein
MHDPYSCKQIQPPERLILIFFPDDGNAYLPKHVEVAFILIRTSTVRCNKSYLYIANCMNMYNYQIIKPTNALFLPLLLWPFVPSPYTCFRTLQFHHQGLPFATS